MKKFKRQFSTQTQLHVPVVSLEKPAHFISYLSLFHNICDYTTPLLQNYVTISFCDSTKIENKLSIYLHFFFKYTSLFHNKWFPYYLDNISPRKIVCCSHEVTFNSGLISFQFATYHSSSFSSCICLIVKSFLYVNIKNILGIFFLCHFSAIKRQIPRLIKQEQKPLVKHLEIFIIL